jgi:hypothetical protein
LDRESNGVWRMAQGNHTEEKRPPEPPRDGVNLQRDGPFTSPEIMLRVRCRTSMVRLEECSLESELVEASLDMSGSQMRIIEVHKINGMPGAKSSRKGA